MTKLAQYLRNDGDVQSRWRRISDRRYLLEITKRSGEFQGFMSKEALNVIHPQFSCSVDELIRRAKGSVQGMLVHATHKVLLGKLVTFTDCDGAETMMVSVTDISSHSQIVEIEGLTVVFEYFEDNGLKIPVIHKASYQTITVSSTELEQRYPKWETRKSIGEGMLLENEELMSYIFSNNETLTVTLPENELA